MCVIIEKKAGKEIPFNMLRSAALVNKDGYGVAVIDRGKIELIRNFDPKGNDPDAFAKIIEQAKDHQVFAHTRLSTVGSKSLENVHPFLVHERDNIYDHDIYFMHNGTMWDHKGDKEKSDTHVFAERILKPMIERLRLIAAYHGENVLDDPLLSQILDTHGRVGNFLVLFDETGHSYKHNEKNGEEWDWGWSSNKYSLERHMDPPKTTTSTPASTAEFPTTRRGGSLVTQHGFPVSPGSYSFKGPHTNYAPPEAPWESRPHVSAGSTFTDHGKTALQKHFEALEQTDGVDVCGLPPPQKEKRQVRVKRKVKFEEERMRRTFLEVANLDSIEDVLDFSQRQMEEIVLEYPQYAVALLLDLQLAYTELLLSQEEEEETDGKVPASQSNVLQ